MSEKFTASNGGTVEIAGNGRMVVTDTNGYKLNENASVTSHSSWLDPAQIDALREYFLHERDQGLGRWRDPESPRYVVYPFSDTRDEVRVLDEAIGYHFQVSRDVALSSSSKQDGMVTAHRYFASHSKVERWHDAKPGEVWVITTPNVANPAAVLVCDREFMYNDGETVPLTYAAIETAKRIYPEPSDD